VKSLPDGHSFFNQFTNCCVRGRKREKERFWKTKQLQKLRADEFEQTDWLKTKQNQIRYLLLLQNLIGSREPVSIAESNLKEQQPFLANDSNAIAENLRTGFCGAANSCFQSQEESGSGGLPDLTLGYFNQTLIGTQNVNNQDVYSMARKRFQGFQVGWQFPLFSNGYSAKVKSANLSTKVAEKQLRSTSGRLQGKHQQALQEYFNNQT